MSSWVWFAFTETSVEAGKNNEYPEPRAYGPAPSDCRTVRNELMDKTLSAAVR
jgi:hypothetical protein